MNTLRKLSVAVFVLLLAVTVQAELNYELSAWGRMRLYNGDPADDVQIFDRISFEVALTETNVLDHLNADGDAAYMVDPPVGSDVEYMTEFNYLNPDYADPVFDMPCTIHGFQNNSAANSILFEFTAMNMTADNDLDGWPGLEMIPKLGNSYGDELVELIDVGGGFNILQVSKGDEFIAISWIGDRLGGYKVDNYAVLEDAENNGTAEAYRWSMFTEFTGGEDMPYSDGYGTVIFSPLGEVGFETSELEEFYLGIGYGSTSQEAQDALFEAFTIFEGLSVDDASSAALPAEIELLPAYPNPFNPSTTVPFTLNRPADVDLGVYNLLGQRVATLMRGMQAAGTHEAVWSGTTLSGHVAGAGVYIVRLQAADQLRSQRITLVK